MSDPLRTGSTRVVLTGAPGAGKTTITRLLAGQFPDRYAAVAESATAVYTARETRWDRLDLAGRRSIQREIYRNQLAQEAAAGTAHPGRVLLLDRGTIDGAAYWPDGPDDYWRELRTTAAAELARYDRVLVLETAAVLGIYDGPAGNRIRFESAAAAVENGKRLLVLWAAHPRVSWIPACATFEEKVERVRRELEG